MEILMFRQSGMPLSLEDMDKYESQWKTFYDKASARAKLDMLKLARLLRYGERQLKRQFEIEKRIRLPNSHKAFNALLDSVQDAPLMIAKSADRTKLVLVVMDQLQA